LNTSIKGDEGMHEFLIDGKILRHSDKNMKFFQTSLITKTSSSKKKIP